MQKTLFTFFLMIVLCGGCSSIRQAPAQKVIPPNPASLVSLTAEFRTIHSSKQKKSAPQIWQLDRQPQRVELFFANTQISEIWSRTSKDLWFFEKVFHQDRQILLYSPLDLRVLGVSPEWLSRSLAIEPETLNALGEGRPGKPFKGWKTLLMRGEHQHMHYDVLWLPEIALAAKVKITTAEGISETEITELWTQADAPDTIPDSRGYRLIDYSDVGDMERDPFVQKIQGQIPGGHDHQH